MLQQDKYLYVSTGICLLNLMRQAGKWTDGIICFPQTSIHINGHHYYCNKTIQTTLLSNKEKFSRKGLKTWPQNLSIQTLSILKISPNSATNVATCHKHQG